MEIKTEESEFKGTSFETFFYKNYMGFVYLIGMEGQPNKYKIGSTRRKNINDRLKQLQTGNAEKLFIKDSFSTEKPFQLEKMLHNRYQSRHLIGQLPLS